MPLTWTWLTWGLGSELAERLLVFRYEAAASQCSVSHSLTSPDVYLKHKTSTLITHNSNVQVCTKKADGCNSRIVARFPSQAEKFVSSRIPDVTLSPLNHFPSHTLLTLTCCYFVFLKSLHHDLSRITGVLFGRNNAEHFTPYWFIRLVPSLKVSYAVMKKLNVWTHWLPSRNYVIIFLWQQLAYSVMEKNIYFWVCIITSLISQILKFWVWISSPKKHGAP